MMTHNLAVTIVTSILVFLLQPRTAFPWAESCTLVPKSPTTCSCPASQMSLKDPSVPAVHHYKTADLEPAAIAICRSKAMAGTSGAVVANEDDFPWMLFLPLISNLNHCPGWARKEKTYTYYFDEVIRLGDDANYHPKDLCIPTAESVVYTSTFDLPERCNGYISAKIFYWITASSQENRFLINARRVGTTCGTGNSAKLCGVGDAIEIDKFLHPGENTIEIKLVKYPDDDYLPYDDIEIYKLQIQLVYP